MQVTQVNKSFSMETLPTIRNIPSLITTDSFERVIKKSQKKKRSSQDDSTLETCDVCYKNYKTFNINAPDICRVPSRYRIPC